MVEKVSMTIYVMTYPLPNDIKSRIQLKDDDFIIGVDQALAGLYKQRIPVHLAVGDFDSLKNKGLLHGLNVETLPVEKDMTDSFYALKRAHEMHHDEIILVGGAGGERIEHVVAHFNLFHHYPNLKMITEESVIFITNKHIQTSHHGYINIFPYQEAIVTLKGFKYPLQSYHLKPFDNLGISNELQSDHGEIMVEKGAILVVLTNKKSA